MRTYDQRFMIWLLTSALCTLLSAFPEALRPLTSDFGPWSLPIRYIATNCAFIGLFGESVRYISATHPLQISNTRYAGSDIAGIVERPWSDLRKGKEMTGSLLARVLLPYGLRSKTMWIAGEAAKGYLMTDLDDAFRRYIPRSGVGSAEGRVAD